MIDNSISKKVETVLNRLQYLYRIGDLVYPRVEGGYITNGQLQLLAHPPLPDNLELRFKNLDGFFVSPLREESYPLNKQSSLVWLTNKRLMTASMVEDYIAKINLGFDDNLRINNIALKNSIFELSELFMPRQGLSDTSLNDMMFGELKPLELAGFEFTNYSNSKKPEVEDPKPYKTSKKRFDHYVKIYEKKESFDSFVDDWIAGSHIKNRMKELYKRITPKQSKIILPEIPKEVNPFNV